MPENNQSMDIQSRIEQIANLFHDDGLELSGTRLRTELKSLVNLVIDECKMEALNHYSGWGDYPQEVKDIVSGLENMKIK